MAIMDPLRVAPPAGAPRAPHTAVVAVDELALRRLESTLALAGLPPTSAVYEPEDLDPARAPEVLVLACAAGLMRRRELLGRAAALHPGSYLVLVGAEDSPGAVRAAVEAGADGVVFEADVERALVPTVLAVASGQVVVPAARGREVAPPILSAREKQILRLVIDGLANKEIAAQLWVAESTVKCHLSAVFQKLGVRSRAEAATVALSDANRAGLGLEPGAGR
jgi:DNA-binding NarL/FixJ family response regulator